MSKALLTIAGITVAAIADADGKQLKSFAKVAGIASTGKKNEELAIALNEFIADANKEAQKAAKSAKLTKSAKMRAMFEAGCSSPGEVAKALEAHYSFVYGVYTRMNDANAAAEQEAAQPAATPKAEVKAEAKAEKSK